LQLAQIRRTSRCAATRCTELATRNRSLDTLAPNAAVVYPILLPDRVEILVSTTTGIDRHTVEATRREVATEVRRFRHALDDHRSNRHRRTFGLAVSLSLIPPPEESLNVQSRAVMSAPFLRKTAELPLDPV